jgi:hypothetical protein
MKNLLKLAVIAVIIVAFNACGSKTNSPEGVAEKWAGHFYKKEFAEAKKLSTEETQKNLDQFEQFSAQGGDQAKKDVKVENMKCVVTGENAACTYLADGKEEKIDLVQKDGKWLVNMSKEAMTGGTTTPEPPADSTQTTEAPK